MATSNFITIQHKRGPVANIPTLADGEFYYAEDTQVLYVGTADDGNVPVSVTIGGVNAQTANYTAVSGDNGKLISFNSSSSVTLTLPSAAPSSSWFVAVENIGSGTLTVSPNGLDIDGSSSNLTLSQNSGFLVYTDGTNYFTMRGAAAGSGSGTVTSVALTMPSVFSVSGSPITSEGTLDVTLETETANTVFAGPSSGSAAAPTFRSIAAADLPSGAGGVNSQTGNYTAVAGDRGKIISFNSSSAVTLTLPSSPPSANWVIGVENVGSGTLSVAPNGLDIDGSSSDLSLAQNQGVWIQTDGSNYFTERGLGSGSSYTAGTNISISSGAISVVNDPTFSGAVTCESTIAAEGVVTFTDCNLLNGASTITTTPPTAGTDYGWKESFYSTTFALGVEEYVFCIKTPNWFSIFGSTNPENNGSTTSPDSGAIFSVNTNGSVFADGPLLVGPSSAGNYNYNGVVAVAGDESGFVVGDRAEGLNAGWEIYSNAYTLNFYSGDLSETFFTFSDAGVFSCTSIQGLSKTQDTNDTIYLYSGTNTNLFLDLAQEATALIFGYNTAETSDGAGVFQIYNNSTSRTQLASFNSAGSSSGANSVSFGVPVYLNGAATITSTPPSAGSDLGWKTSLYSDSFAIGVATATLAVYTDTWFSVFSPTSQVSNDATSGTTGFPDLTSICSLGQAYNGSVYNGAIYFNLDLSASASDSNFVQIEGNPSQDVAGVTGSCLGWAHSNVAWLMQFDTSGNLGIEKEGYAVDGWTTSSDLTLKNVQGPVTGVLDAIDTIQPVRYTWKPREPKKMIKQADTETVHIGLVAQELTPHWPEIAKPTPSGDHLGINYGHYTAILTQAIKELRQEVKAVSAELAALKATQTSPKAS